MSESVDYTVENNLPDNWEDQPHITLVLTDDDRNGLDVHAAIDRRMYGNADAVKITIQVLQEAAQRVVALALDAGTITSINDLFDDEE